MWTVMLVVAILFTPASIIQQNNYGVNIFTSGLRASAYFQKREEISTQGLGGTEFPVENLSYFSKIF
jgi:hypothetical protein